MEGTGTRAAGICPLATRRVSLPLRLPKSQRFNGGGVATSRRTLDSATAFPYPPSMAEARKIVWILGAGFSRSLGAPMLAQLLASDTYDDLALRYPKAEHPALHKLAEPVYWLHQWGLKRTLWSDAEGFLELLDTAHFLPKGTLARRLTDALATQAPRFVTDLFPAGVDLHLLRDTARRLVAAEVCAFLQEFDADVLRQEATTPERWKPYRSWILQLGQHDTVLTFNYDRVLERNVA